MYTLVVLSSVDIVPVHETCSTIIHIWTANRIPFIVFHVIAVCYNHKLHAVQLSLIGSLKDFVLQSLLPFSHSHVSPYGVWAVSIMLCG